MLGLPFDLPLLADVPFFFSVQGEHGPIGPPGPPGDDGHRVSNAMVDI